MQLLRPSLVPAYLRNSSFYLGLNVTEDDEFSIPPNHMKLDTNVDNLADMTELLNTIRFWGLDIIPQPMIDFVARQPHIAIDQVLEPFRDDLQFLTTVCHIVSEGTNGNGRLEKAMERGNLEVVQYFHNNREPFTDRAIALAAGQGALVCLQYALAFRPPNLYGHSYDGHSSFCGKKVFLLEVTPTGMMKIAASSGRCEVLKYLHSQGCFIKSAAIAAANAGHFDCLEYAVQQGALLCGERPYSTPPHRGSLAQRLARMKHPNQRKLLAQALSRGSEMDEQTVRKFVQYGNWECFKLCVPYIIRPSTDLIAVVVKKGYLACLRHLYQNNATSTEVKDSGLDWITYAAGSRYSRLLPTDIAHLALSKRQWKCLRFLITHYCPMEKYLTTSLVQAGQLKLFKLAIEHGCKVSVRVVCRFAKEGNLELLQHALEHGCERSEEILKAAAQHGQLQCLKYAHAQGCPWQTPISLTAARGAHLECLQYLQAHSSVCSVLFLDTASSSGTPATLPRSVHSEQIIALMIPVLTMQLLRPSLVPEYIRNSSFYLGFNVTEDDEFCIPPNHTKLDTYVDTLADMTALLNTIRFWGLDIIPQALFDFAARQPRNLINKTLEIYREDLPFLTTVCSILSRDKDGKLLLEKAMESGNVEALQYLHNKGGPFSAREIALAAGKGALDCLEYALSFGKASHYGHCNDVFLEAVRNGCMVNILFLQQKGFHLRTHSTSEHNDLMKIAASSGQLEVLKYLHSQGCSIKSAAIAAADSGHFDCLEYAIQHGALLQGESAHTEQGTLAQRLVRAARCKLFPLSGQELNTQTALIFARYGHWECFKLCLEQGARPSLNLIAVVVEQGHLPTLEYLHQLCVSKAEACGKSLNWLASRRGRAGSSQGKTMGVSAVSDYSAARHGQLQCLKYAHAQGCPWSAQVSLAAARGGHLECLQYLHAHGCPSRK